MRKYFLDSSALVKRYQYEVGSDRLADILVDADRLAVSRLAQLEVSAAIVRRARDSNASAVDLDATLMFLIVS
jgi:predicted nucleic acid-binding protein